MTALVIYGPINLRAETLLECVVQMCAQRHAIQDSPDGGTITQPDGCTKICNNQDDDSPNMTTASDWWKPKCVHNNDSPIMYTTSNWWQLKCVHNVHNKDSPIMYTISDWWQLKCVKKRQPQYVPNIQLMTAQLCTKHPIGESPTSPVCTQQAE